MQCPCGSQDGEYKSGVSKKNGKPYRGWKCNQCGDMQFLKTNGSGGSNYPSKPQAQSAGAGSQMLLELQEIRKLLQVLVTQKTGQVQIAQTELVPDEDIPF